MPADSYEQDREDFAVGERFDRESTEAEALEAIAIGAEEEEPTCDDCGHAVRLHMDMYGCQYERGDAPGDGEHAAMAFPPCGCQAFAEEYERQQGQKALRQYAAAVKRMGKALVDLGRSCDQKEAV